MKKKTKIELQDELRPEYDMRELLKRGVRGKYVAAFRKGTNLVLLAPDVAHVFPTEDSVNQALRLVIELSKLQNGKRGTVKA